MKITVNQEHKQQLNTKYNAPLLHSAGGKAHRTVKHNM